MKEKATRMRIILGIGAEETLLGVGTPDGKPTQVQVPVGLSARLGAVLAVVQEAITQSMQRAEQGLLPIPYPGGQGQPDH